MSRKLPARQRPPGPGTVLGAIAALLGATACSGGCATEVSAPGRLHQTPAAVLIVAAVGFAVAAVVLVRVAIRLEHRFRSGGTPAPLAAPVLADSPEQAVRGLRDAGQLADAAGAEGLARMAEADRSDAKRRP